MTMGQSTATSQPVVGDYPRYRLRMQITGAIIADITVAVIKR